MEEKIELLIALQACDGKIEDIQRRTKEGPVKIQRLEDELKETHEKWQEELHKLEAIKKEGRNTEIEIDDIETKATKSEGKLPNVKSNKEYTAVLKEIEDLNREKSHLEDKSLEIMEQTEELESICLTMNTEKESIDEKLKVKKVEVQGELQALEKRLIELKEERARFCNGIESGLLEKYDLIRNRKGGTAVSPVMDGVCQACHMGIPPQKYNELIRGGELLTCPHCQRIIYWGDNERFQKTEEKNK